MNFPEYILKLRQERGLKQSDVASSIGVTVRAYQAYEYGKVNLGCRRSLRWPIFMIFHWTNWSAERQNTVCNTKLAEKLCM